MNTGIARRSWFRFLTFLLPLITLLLFGLSGGWVRANAWISGAALACAEVALFMGFLPIADRRQKHAAPAPFRIASGFLAGIYAIAVLACVALLGYLFKISALVYVTVHFILLAGYAVITALLALNGKYAGAQEQKQSDQRNIKNEMLKRLTSIRAQIRVMPTTPDQSDLLREFAQLEETITFGDPARMTAWADITGVLEQHLSLLEDQMQLMRVVDMSQKEELTTETVELVREIRQLILERNNLTAPFKSNSG